MADAPEFGASLQAHLVADAAHHMAFGDMADFMGR